jgi:lipopolysaccharide/colanic/teichoic acid biosynthesis glycosyltransferase
MGILGGSGLPKGALIGTFGVASLGVLLARAALVTRTDEDAHSRVLILGCGARAAEVARLIRTQAFGEYQVAGMLDPKLDLAAPRDGEVLRAVAGVEAAPPPPILTVQPDAPAAEVAMAAAPAVVPATQLVVAAPSPSVEASVAALPTSVRTEPVEGGPLAAVFPLPSAPAPSLQIAARTLPQAVEQLRADTIVIATEDPQQPLPVDELIRLRLSGVTVLPAHGFAERVLRRIPLSLLRPTDLAVGPGLTSPMSQAAKRVFDLMMSCVLLLCAAPVLAILAVLIKLDSEGPVFYVQERTGRGGKPYRVHKLRTMHKDAEKVSGPVWAAHGDPRVTRVGAFLRTMRLDEIPQVFAVLRGDMSFVGPRPERPFFVQQIKQQIPYFGLREAVKPGITGWAQIRYSYGSTIEDAKSKLEYDLYYVEHRSLFLDLVICFHTAKIVLFGRGAR